MAIVRRFYSVVDFGGEQSGHGVFDRGKDARNSIPQCCLTYGYRPFSVHRALFSRRVLLGFYVIRKSTRDILLLGGGSNRFHP